MTTFNNSKGFRRLISAALGALMLITSTLSLATEGDLFFSDPIDLSGFLGPAGGEVEEKGPPSGLDLAYTVTFMVSGAAYATQSIDPDTLVSRPADPAPPTTGEFFAGWYTAEASPLDKNLFDFWTLLSADTTLYAGFSAQDLVVRFRDTASGDWAVISAMRVVHGGTVADIGDSPLTIPLGKKLAYWYAEGDAGKAAYDFGAPVTQSLTLCPMLEDITAVVFNAEGMQSWAMPMQAGQKVTKPADPSLSGYTFAYWSNNPASLGDGSDAFDFNTPIHGLTMLYAVFTPNKVSYELAYWYETRTEGKVGKLNASWSNHPAVPLLTEADFTDPGEDVRNYTYRKSIKVTAADDLLPAGETPGQDTMYAIAEKYKPQAYTNAGFVQKDNDPMRFATFRHAVVMPVAGNGTTVINVLYRRNLYTLRTNLAHSGAVAAIAGETYTGTQYCFTGKFGTGLGLTYCSYDKVTRTDNPAFQLYGLNNGGAGTNPGGTSEEYHGVGTAIISGFVPLTGQLFTMNAVYRNDLRKGWRHYYNSALPEELALLSEADIAAIPVLDLDPNPDIPYVALYPEDGEPNPFIKYKGIIYTFSSVSKGMDPQSSVPSGWTQDNSWVQFSPQYTGSLPRFYKFYDSGGKNTAELKTATLATLRLSTICQGYRVYNRRTFTLTHNLFGHGQMPSGQASKSYIEGQPIARPPDPIVTDGWTFLDWYMDSSFTVPWDAAQKMPSNNIVMYAKFEEAIYDVAYRMAKGGIKHSDERVVKGKLPIHIPPDYSIGDTVPGYGIFLGWYFETGDGLLLPFTNRAVILRDYEVYALWDTVNYTVTFCRNEDGSKGIFDTRTVESGQNNTVAKSRQVLPATPESRQGYAFVGWYESKDGSGPRFTAATMVAGDMILYPQWAAVAVTVNFYNNHTVNDNTRYDVGEIANASKKYDDLLASFADPSREGYAFTGWFAQRSGGPKWDFATDKIATEGTLNLYAQWTAKSVNVIFYNNHSAGDNTRYAAGDAANAGKKFGETLADFTAPTRTGYDFGGWFTARSGGAEYVPGTDVIDTEGPLELYAQWSLKQVEVRFFLNYHPADDTRYATGDAANAGKLYGDMLSAFADPVRDRYEFVGWFTARSGGVEVIPGAVVLNTEVPLNIYAQWKSAYVTIRYRPNDPAMGAASPGSETLHKTLDAAKGSTAAANPGFTFVNWTDSQGRAVSADATFIPAKAAGENIEATYTANFRELDAVTIHYVAREGGTAYPTSSRVNPVTGEPARSTATPAPGYVFVNWTNAQGNVVSTGISFRPRKADHEVWRDGTTFYANFAIADSGTTITIPVTKVWDVPQGVANLPNVTITLRRDGKPYRTLQLGGGIWSGQFTGVPKTAANGSAYAYTVSENMLPGFTLTSVTGSVEAGFVLTNTARELTVTFVDWNGTLLKQQAVPYGGSATPPDDPTRDGHEFAGWIGRYENVTRNEYVYAKYRRAGEGFFSLLDAAVPLAGGAVSNFGDCVE